MMQKAFFNHEVVIYNSIMPSAFLPFCTTICYNYIMPSAL